MLDTIVRERDEREKVLAYLDKELSRQFLLKDRPIFLHEEGTVERRNGHYYVLMQTSLPGKDPAGKIIYAEIVQTRKGLMYLATVSQMPEVKTLRQAG